MEGKKERGQLEKKMKAKPNTKNGKNIVKSTI